MPPLLTPVTSYDWARHLFDYVTVQSPQNDFLPNIAATPVTGSPYATLTASPVPQPVQNRPITVPPQANGDNEWNVGVNGLINLNTASWKILSMLPLVVSDTTGQVVAAQNEQMAKAIVAYREANGPYQSIFDLLKIPANFGTLTNAEFGNPANLNETVPADGPKFLAEDNAANGELMPPGRDAFFRYRSLQLARISNLATTGSETFTVYILVQGWRNGATAPEVERRAAFFVDRNGVNTQIPLPAVVPIPAH